MLQEIQRHLPSSDSLGTFYLGKRLATPSGHEMAARRPNSAIATRNCGISMGAEERQSQRSSSSVRPLSAAASAFQVRDHRRVPGQVDLSHWLATRQRELHVSCDREELMVSSSSNTIANNSLFSSNSQPNPVLRCWQADILDHGRERVTYPTLAVGIDDTFRRGAVDRLSTLLRAMATLKHHVERQDHAVAIGAEGLLCHSFCVGDNGQETVFGANYNSKHVSLAVGSELFLLPLFGNDDEPLSSTQIKESILECIAESERSTLAADSSLFRGSFLPLPKWSKIVHQLKSVSPANTNTLQLLNKSLLFVTIMPQEVVAPSASATPTSQAKLGYSACGTQLIVYANGQTILQASSMFVNGVTLASCASWISQTANNDPLSVATKRLVHERVLTAVRRTLPLSRPTTAPGKGKGAAPPPPEPENVEETTSLVQVAVSSHDDTLSPLANGLEGNPSKVRRLQLWLPIHQRLEVETWIREHRAPLESHVFEFSWGPAPLLLVSVAAALDRIVPRGEGRPPLVQLACTDEKPISQSWLCGKEMDCVLGLLRSAAAGTWSLDHPSRETMDSVRRAVDFTAHRIARTLNTASPSSSSSLSGDDGSMYGPSRMLCKQNLIPRAASLLRSGEACGPADVVISVSRVVVPCGTSFLHEDLLWFAENCAVDSRFGISFCTPNDRNGDTCANRALLCVLTHRHDDAHLAFQLSHAIQTAASTLAKLL